MGPLWQNRRPRFQSLPVRPEVSLAPVPSPEKRRLAQRSREDRRSACPMEVISPEERLALSQELSLMQEGLSALDGQAVDSMALPVNWEVL